MFEYKTTCGSAILLDDPIQPHSFDGEWELICTTFGEGKLYWTWRRAKKLYHEDFTD